MRKGVTRRLILAGLAVIAMGAAWFGIFAFTDLELRTMPLEFNVTSGSSLRTIARDMTRAGVLKEPYRFEILARLMGKAGDIKAGSYELNKPLTPVALLQKITSNDYIEMAVTLIAGWTFTQVRDTLNQQTGLRHETEGMTDAQIMQRLTHDQLSAPEGWFFPDTYYYSTGDADLSILRRAYHLMRKRLDEQWAQRAPGLPLKTPYQALILASIVEKETGKETDRPMIAGVFVNRLKIGMRLQTDPTVIYGLGAHFEGDLHARDLLIDHPYNTYTRKGMPPTPIALPSLASIHAVLHPAKTDALYFVANGSGGSYFSRTLRGHDRAIKKWQKAEHQ